MNGVWAVCGELPRLREPSPGEPKVSGSNPDGRVGRGDASGCESPRMLTPVGHPRLHFPNCSISGRPGEATLLAVELERSPKGRARLRRILAGYVAARHTSWPCATTRSAAAWACWSKARPRRSVLKAMIEVRTWPPHATPQTDPSLCCRSNGNRTGYTGRYGESVPLTQRDRWQKARAGGAARPSKKASRLRASGSARSSVTQAAASSTSDGWA